MKLEEAKNQVAKTHGCEDWGDLLQQVHIGKLKGDVEMYSDEAAFLYAEEKIKDFSSNQVVGLPSQIVLFLMEKVLVLDPSGIGFTASKIPLKDGTYRVWFEKSDTIEFVERKNLVFI